MGHGCSCHGTRVGRAARPLVIRGRLLAGRRIHAAAPQTSAIHRIPQILRIRASSYVPNAYKGQCKGALNGMWQGVPARPGFVSSAPALAALTSR